MKQKKFFKRALTVTLLFISSIFIILASGKIDASNSKTVNMTFSPRAQWSNGSAVGMWSISNSNKEEIKLNYSSITNATLKVYEIDVLIETMSLTSAISGNDLFFEATEDPVWGAKLDLASYSETADLFYIPFHIPVEDYYITITFDMVISDTINPVINGQTNYITNVDNPITEANIKSGLYAIDNIDGHIPSSAFVLVTDGYTANKTTLGTYDVNYKVSDSAGNWSFVTVKVHVVDIAKPVISGQSSYTIVYNQTQNLTTVKNNLTVTDNYNTGLTATLVEDNYTANKTQKGSYTLKYQATDSSGNKSDIYVVTITVIDNIKPVISGTNSYTRAYNNKLELSAIKSALTATDGYDGNLNAALTLKSDNYSSNYSNKGTYQVVYSVKDSSNNTADYVITINVIDNIKPTISGQATYSTGTTNKISEATIRAALTAIDDYDGALSLELISDGYSAHYQQIRSHKITYKATDSSGNSTDYVVTINVFDDIPPIIYTNDAFINLDGTLNYTLEQIIQHLINVGDLEASVNFENYVVFENDYDPETPGEYEVVLMRSESASSDLKERLSIGIRVLEPNPITDPEPPITSTNNLNWIIYLLAGFGGTVILVAFINRKRR